jgi:uncharacterized membrane protein YeaQ/YmgE (transglycosylase-associated protein family)
MTADLIVVAVVVGLVAGWIADVAMKGGGYGLIGDPLLGVGGSMVTGVIFRTLGVAPNGGWMAMVLWHTHA